MGYQFILASASPRRREILSQAGIRHTVVPSGFDERGITGKSPEEYVKELALAKARDVYKKLDTKETDELKSGITPDGESMGTRKENPGRESGKKTADDSSGMVVLGADTVVVHCGEILNKPKNRADAARMLAALQGDMHEVYTGVALICGHPNGECETRNFSVKTEVYFYPMTEREIEEYLDCGEYTDKAGAYAIQGKSAAYIREIRGDYYNVVGLPLSAVIQELKDIGAAV